jgi:hypothetical protein
MGYCMKIASHRDCSDAPTRFERRCGQRAPATQAFLLLVIATVYEGLFRAKGAKSSGIEGEAL